MSNLGCARSYTVASFTGSSPLTQSNFEYDIVSGSKNEKLKVIFDCSKVAWKYPFIDMPTLIILQPTSAASPVGKDFPMVLEKEDPVWKNACLPTDVKYFDYV
jgi:hypothetical protein